MPACSRESAAQTRAELHDGGQPWIWMMLRYDVRYYGNVGSTPTALTLKEDIDIFFILTVKTARKDEQGGEQRRNAVRSDDDSYHHRLPRLQGRACRPHLTTPGDGLLFVFFRTLLVIGFDFRRRQALLYYTASSLFMFSGDMTGFCQLARVSESRGDCRHWD